jgi:two-component system, OmpR family, phosphate regulon response regulator OmpR
MNAKLPILPDDASHVMIVDDDSRIRSLLSRFLRENGYRVTTAEHAAEARQKLSGMSFDLLVLDVMMPGQNGFDFATDLRETSDVPILMLTARADIADRLKGLELGADDYLTKPFEPKELLLRIASILRRSAAAPVRQVSVESVRFGPFVFQLGRGELRRGDEVFRLTDREREMLRIMAEKAPDAVTREALAGTGIAANERTVDVQINRLRRKIETDPANPLFLQTARGSGYRLMVEQ